MTCNTSHIQTADLGFLVGASVTGPAGMASRALWLGLDGGLAFVIDLLAAAAVNRGSGRRLDNEARREQIGPATSKPAMRRLGGRAHEPAV